MLSFWNLLREGKMNYSYSLYYVEWNYFEYVTAYVCIHMHVEVVGQSQWYSLTCLELAK